MYECFFCERKLAPYESRSRWHKFKFSERYIIEEFGGFPWPRHRCDGIRVVPMCPGCFDVLPPSEIRAKLKEFADQVVGKIREAIASN